MGLFDFIPNFKKPSDQPKKVQQPPAVTCQQAGLHPMSKTAQGLMNVNKKKENNG
jgi:hypothetical protein